MPTENIIDYESGLCPVTKNTEHVEIIELKPKLSFRVLEESSSEESRIIYKCSSHKHIAKFCDNCPIVLSAGFNIPNKRGN